ncbi:MAG TPA: hypothetical protein VF666_02575 [Pyrinomonadaceae bacterium]|jgi:hypothetical protein
MTLNNKILPVALVAALLGGSVGAFVMRPSSNRVETPAASETTKSLNNVAPARTDDATTGTDNADVAGTLDGGSTNKLDDSNLSDDEREAYRAGFVDGARTVGSGEGVKGNTLVAAAAPAATRVVYRDRTRTRTRYARSSNNARQVYYDYEQPRKRSFWSKHRDKLTVAGGAGAGAILGGLLGGKKGAAIGALAGGGGSALYTYKLRKRNRRY